MSGRAAWEVESLSEEEILGVTLRQKGLIGAVIDENKMI